MVNIIDRSKDCLKYTCRTRVERDKDYPCMAILICDEPGCRRKGKFYKCTICPNAVISVYRKHLKNHYGIHQKKLETECIFIGQQSVSSPSIVSHPEEDTCLNVMSNITSAKHTIDSDNNGDVCEEDDLYLSFADNTESAEVFEYESNSHVVLSPQKKSSEHTNGIVTDSEAIGSIGSCDDRRKPIMFMTLEEYLRSRQADPYKYSEQDKFAILSKCFSHGLNFKDDSVLMKAYPLDMKLMSRKLVSNTLDLRSYNMALFDRKKSFGKLIVEHVFQYAGTAPATKSNSSMKEMSNSDALFHLTLSKFCSEHPDNVNQTLVALLNYARAQGTSLNVPQDITSVKGVWDNESKGRSIYNNIPVPRPMLLLGCNGYSNLSIEDILRRCMSLPDRAPLPFDEFYDSLHGNCKRGQEWLNIHRSLLDPPPKDADAEVEIFKVKVILWSDGATPYWQKESPIHICTATIGAPDGDHSGSRTFPIWLGPSKEDPAIVEKFLFDELNRLQKGQCINGKPFYCYHALMCRVVRVQVFPFAWICDRPEKACRTRSRLGGKYHSRYGVIMDPMSITGKKKQFHCCEKCVSALYDSLRSSSCSLPNAMSCCPRCHSFGISPSGIKFAVPKKSFPKGNQSLRHSYYDQINGETGRDLKSYSLTFENMKESFNLAMNSFIHGSGNRNNNSRWTQPQVKTFCQVSGMNESATESLIKVGTKIFLAKTALEEDRSGSGDCIGDDLKRKAMSVDNELQDDVTGSYYPPIWNLNNFGIADFPSALAHQLFLGVQKYLCVELLPEFLKHEKLKKCKGAFIHSLEECLKCISNLSLDHLKIQSSVSKGNGNISFSGWKSKDYLTFCKFQKWIVSFSIAKMSTKSDLDSKINAALESSTEVEDSLQSMKGSLNNTYKSSTFDPLKLSKLKPSNIRSWCIRRHVSTSSMPNDNQPHACSLWFRSLLMEPSKLFADYNHDQITSFTAAHHPMIYQTMLDYSDNEFGQREKFNSLVDKYLILPIDQYSDFDSVKKDYHAYCNDLIKIFTLYSALVANIMGDEAPSEKCLNNIDRFALLFLSKVNKLDLEQQKGLRKEERPKILRAYNFITLLNIPNDIRRFGHLRLLWELGRIGEAFISLIKPHIGSGENYCYNALIKYLADAGYHDLTSSLVDNLVEAERNSDRSKPNSENRKDEFSKGDLKKAEHLLREEAMNQRKDYYTATPTGIGRSLQQKIRDTSWIEVSKDVVPPKLFGFRYNKYGTRIFADRESNSIHRYKIYNPYEFHALFTTPIIACVTQCSTDNIYVLHYNKEATFATRVNASNCTQGNAEVLFGCFYFEIMYPTEKDIYKEDNSYKVPHDKDFDSSKYFLKESDMITTFLCAHPIKPYHYYVFRNDWKELSVCSSDGNYLCNISFHLPTSAKVIDDTLSTSSTPLEELFTTDK